MSHPPDGTQSVQLPYTGVVCRHCTSPVANLVEATPAALVFECPACRRVWTTPPPVKI